MSLVDFVYNRASAGIYEHHPIVGINVAILSDGRSPIGRHGFELNAGRDLRSDNDSFLSGNGPNPLFCDVTLDFSAVLRLDLDGRISSAGGGGYGSLGTSSSRQERRCRRNHQIFFHRFLQPLECDAAQRPGDPNVPAPERPGKKRQPYPRIRIESEQKLGRKNRDDVPLKSSLDRAWTVHLATHNEVDAADQLRCSLERYLGQKWQAGENDLDE
jgi:hypothetical protein